MLFSPSAFYWSALPPCHWKTWCGGPPGTPCSSCPREWPYRSDSSPSYRLDMRRSWLGPRRYTSPGSQWSCSGSCFVPGSLLSPDCAGDVSRKRWPPPAVNVKLKIDGVHIKNWGGVGASIFWHFFKTNTEINYNLVHFISQSSCFKLMDSASATDLQVLSLKPIESFTFFTFQKNF